MAFRRGTGVSCRVTALVSARSRSRRISLVLGLLQAGAAHEEFVDAGGGLASFGNGPHDQRLPPPHVAGGENPGYRTHVVWGGGDIAARLEVNVELFDHAFFYRTRETEREQHQIRFQDELGSRNRLEFRRGANAGGVKLLYISVSVAGKVRRTDGPIPQAAFFVRTF